MTVTNPGNSALRKSEPYAAVQRIRSQNHCEILASECGPWNLLQLIVWRQSYEADVAVGDPKIPRSVLGQGLHQPAWSRRWNKPVILQVADRSKRGSPDSPARVLKQGPPPLIRQSAADNLSHAGLGPVLAVHRHLAVIQAVQPVKGSEPNASVP